MDGKMRLGGAGLSDMGRKPANVTDKGPKVQNVKAKPAAMDIKAKEPIDGCCSHGPVKAAGKKS
jgi:hypothetical protein